MNEQIHCSRKTNLFVRFWENSKIPKSPSEIIWPLEIKMKTLCRLFENVAGYVLKFLRFQTSILFPFYFQCWYSKFTDQFRRRFFICWIRKLVQTSIQGTIHILSFTFLGFFGPLTPLAFINILSKNCHFLSPLTLPTAEILSGKMREHGSQWFYI